MMENTQIFAMFFFLAYTAVMVTVIMWRQR